MHFDDRLATVLRQPPRGDAIARIQYRQLLDLLGTMPPQTQGGQVDRALERLGEISRRIAPDERARIIDRSDLRLRNARLVAMLAEGEPMVASAAIASASLSEEQWLDLVPALPVHVRGILRHRRDLGQRVEDRLEQLGVHDRALPMAQEASDSNAAPAPAEPIAAPDLPEPEQAEITKAAPEPEPEVAASRPDTAIGAIVRRIEAFRKERAPAMPSAGAMVGDSPRLPLGDGERFESGQPLASFDFATDAEGRIVWADAPVAPMAVGLRLASADGDAPVAVAASMVRKFKARQPVLGELATITGAPAIAGAWQIDASPQFDDLTGRFTGFCGRARRPSDRTEAASAPPNEADRMRQLLHELKTPTNAIQMSAEVIQQQLYGPTPHEYRALAATIASDTARILAGFDELDRLVRLDSGAMALERGEADLASAVTSAVSYLQAHTAQRQSGFTLELAHDAIPVALERKELDRLVWRLLATLAGATAPSEYLALRCGFEPAGALLEITLPASLARLDGEHLFNAAAHERPRPLSGGMFGTGFSLRLAAAEAAAAGGSLVREGNLLQIRLPGLTLAKSTLSQI